jgi:hypothetical protein
MKKLRKVSGVDDLGMVGEMLIRTFDKQGNLLRTIGPFRNKVVTSDGYGRNLILNALTPYAVYSPIIDSASLGDSNTAAADANTALGNSLVADIPITNHSVANNVLTIDVFVADANLPNDTYEEFGLFANARMMTRVVISPAYTKASGEDTLFTYTLTMTG